MYGSETWTLTKRDEQRISMWERKVLRRISEPVNDRGEWRLRTNKEIYELYNELELVTVIKVVNTCLQMSDERFPKKWLKW